MEKTDKFIYNGSPVVTLVDKDGKPWFVASHVCKILKHTNVSQRLKDHCSEKGIRRADILTNGGMQRLLIINEPNLYRLIFRSKVKGAEKFQNWVYEEVLPSIRDKGYYSISESLRKKSTEKRNLLTTEWKKNGVSKSYHFINLTREEYKQLQFEKGKRKKDFSESELKTLMALEALETLNLHYNPVDGYIECKESLQKTAGIINDIKNKPKEICEEV